VILNDLAKYSMTRRVARSLCDSWASCSIYIWLVSLREHSLTLLCDPILVGHSFRPLHVIPPAHPSVRPSVPCPLIRTNQ